MPKTKAPPAATPMQVTIDYLTDHPNADFNRADKHCVKTLGKDLSRISYGRAKSRIEGPKVRPRRGAKPKPRQKPLVQKGRVSVPASEGPDMDLNAPVNASNGRMASGVLAEAPSSVQNLIERIMGQDCILMLVAIPNVK